MELMVSMSETGSKCVRLTPNEIFLLYQLYSTKFPPAKYAKLWCCDVNSNALYSRLDFCTSKCEQQQKEIELNQEVMTLSLATASLVP